VVRAALISGRQNGQQALTATACQSDECAPRPVGVNQTN